MNINFKFIATTRALMVLDNKGELLDNFFYNQYEDIHTAVKRDMEEYLRRPEVKSYSKDLSELNLVAEDHVIKVIFEDDDYITTSIHGTLQDIINHYSENNMTADNQVKKIEFIESHLLDDASSYTYLFAKNDNGILV